MDPPAVPEVLCGLQEPLRGAVQADPEGHGHQARAHSLRQERPAGAHGGRRHTAGGVMQEIGLGISLADASFLCIALGGDRNKILTLCRLWIHRDCNHPS